MRLLTIANQETCRVAGIYGTARSGTAGGGSLRLKTYSVASTVGQQQTPQPRHPSAPAASVTAFQAPTAGTFKALRMSVGLAQTGGMGGWVNLEAPASIQLLANGGANGNADVVSIMNAASVAFDATVEIVEGS